MGKTVRKQIGFSLWRRTFLPPIIVERPLGISDMSKNTAVTRADDQFFIVDESSALDFLLVFRLQISNDSIKAV